MIHAPPIAVSLCRLGATLGVIALGLSCGVPPAKITTVDHVGKALPQKNASALIKQVRLTNDAYRTLKAVHRVALEITIDHRRSEKRTFRGVLAIQRPDRFRLQILGPMGVKLIDLLYNGGKAQLIYLAKELSKSSRLPMIMDRVAEDIGVIYRLDPEFRADMLIMEESVSLASGRAPLYTVKELLGETVVRTMTIFAATLAIARAERHDDSDNSLTITYGDYERHDRVLVPRSIHLSREGTLSYWLSISVESVQLNQELDRKLFRAE